VKRAHGATGPRPVIPSPVRRPHGLVNQTRWLFTGLTVFTLLVVLPQVLTAASPLGRALAALAAAVLLGTWGYRYLRGTESALRDAAEAAATGLFLAVCPTPDMVLSYAFAALWLRAVYGNLTGFVRYVAFVLIGLGAGELTWSWVPGHGGQQSWAVVQAFPVLLLVAGVARFLAVNLLAREQTQSRDLTLARLGARLLDADTEARIVAAGVWAATRICAATPGLCTAWLVEAEAGLSVLRKAGTSFPLPAHLPWPERHRSSQASPPPLDTRHQLADVMTTQAGLTGTWHLVPLAGQSGHWILLGAPGRVPPEAVVAVESLTHHLGLALRNVHARQRLAAEATTDALTGLTNRAAFEQAVTATLASGAPAAVLYVDLDRFKAINDTWGHAAGDDVLRHIADRLRQSVRPTDIVTRLGGDEFAVLMPGLSHAAATQVADRLSTTLSGPMIIAGRPIEIGASIGVAVDTSDAAHLIETADQAMYAAKRRRAVTSVR
jgi:diguanylate cyclase (GGDEF)-like protein